MSEMSQATIIGKPRPKSWDDFERGCLATFGGGYRTKDEIEIFHHGISTVFNLLRAEFPPAEQCKAAPDMLAALKKAVYELNAIRARDGVPYTNYGIKSDVCPDYFSSVVDECFAAVKQAQGA